MLHLRPEDEFLLLAHGPRTPMQIGALLRYAVPPGPPRTFASDVRAHLGRRIPATPLAVVLEPSPWGFDTDAWRGLATVDLDRHVDVVDETLTERALHELVAREVMRELDLRHPPFRVVVVNELADGSAAMWLTSHHALADGVGFQSLLRGLSDEGPVAADVPRLRRRDERRPVAPVWVAGATARFVRQARAARRRRVELAAAREEFHSFRRETAQARHKGPTFSLSGPTSTDRSYTTLSLPLSTFRAVGSRLGGTVNDVFLAMSGGALRSFLLELGDLPAEPLVALGARSYRRPEHGDLGNYIVSLEPQLGTHIADPVERFRAVQASAALERRRSELQEPLMGVKDKPFGSRERRRRHAERAGTEGSVFTANVALSNVPGPAAPQWLAGYRQLSNHPTPILGAGRFLNVTLRRYCDALDLGVMTDAAKVPDAGVLARHLTAALHELTRVAGVRG